LKAKTEVEGSHRRTLPKPTGTSPAAENGSLSNAGRNVLHVCDAIDDDESNRYGKSELKRIVSMLTRLIQPNQSVAEDAFEYEYEYRKAEYEYEEN
jgi:hypothetical protein